MAERLKANFGNRVLAAHWDMNKTLLFPVTIKIKGIDKLGLLHEITEVISHLHNSNIRKLEIEVNEGIFESIIQMYVHDTDEVKEILTSLKHIHDVKEAARL